MIRESTATCSTVCASSDYEQLAAICDRVGVIGRGRLIGILEGPDVTKDRIADLRRRSSVVGSQPPSPVRRQLHSTRSLIH